jgi:hypothetical protein
MAITWISDDVGGKPGPKNDESQRRRIIRTRLRI